MAVGIYILHLHPAGKNGPAFLQEAARYVDPVRRDKAEHRKNPEAKAASLGAGMLLQKIAWDMRDGVENAGTITFEEEELLALLQKRICKGKTGPLEFTYRYGEMGKPEILDFPKKFNLSHSGEYVICAVADGEVGADIQKWVPYKERTAERFFAPEEGKLLQELDESRRMELFYRLWARKEAYGKYTGQGIGRVVQENLWNEQAWAAKGIRFLELQPEEGYSLAVCYSQTEV